jgi:hypothetical protein
VLWLHACLKQYVLVQQGVQCCAVVTCLSNNFARSITETFPFINLRGMVTVVTPCGRYWQVLSQTVTQTELSFSSPIKCLSLS